MQNILKLLLFGHLLLLSGAAGSTSFLKGVGYREQELQLAKTNAFNSEKATGVREVSMGGGTSIFIKGVGLSENAQANAILLKSEQFGGQLIPAPPLTEDDAFGSHPQLGMINYRLPSLEELFQMSFAVFNEHGVMKFTLYVKVESKTFTCLVAANCAVHYKRTYTPVLHHFSPSVVYSTATPDIWFDPKNVMSLLGEIPEDDLPFINLKLGESLLDFEDRISADTTFNSYSLNRIRGVVGELDNGNHPIKFLWETGRAQAMNGSVLVCSYDEKDCYQSKVVPVIFETSASKGFTTGGQELIIKGYGFKGRTLSVKVDGQPCKLSSNQTDEIRCTVRPKNTPSLTGNFQGGRGLSRAVYKDYKMANDFITSPFSYKRTLTSFDLPYFAGDGLAQLVKGWFIPPISTRYRFFQSCDDSCHLQIGRSPNQVTSLNKLVQISKAVGYRNYFGGLNQQFDLSSKSDWVSLEEGQPYYIEAQHQEVKGADHMTVAIEIERNTTLTTSRSHHHSKRESQYLGIKPKVVTELIQITIVGADTGSLLSVKMVHPSGNSKKDWNFKISTGDTASTLWKRVRMYYFNYFNSAVKVRRSVVDIYEEVVVLPEEDLPEGETSGEASKGGETGSGDESGWSDSDEEPSFGDADVVPESDDDIPEEDPIEPESGGRRLLRRVLSESSFGGSSEDETQDTTAETDSTDSAAETSEGQDEEDSSSPPATPESESENQPKTEKRWVRKDIVFEIEANRMQHKPTVKDILTHVEGSASVKVGLPQDVRLSRKPFTEKYRIRCVDKFGTASHSFYIQPSASSDTIRAAIEGGCPWTFGAIQVKKAASTWYGHGFDIFLRFKGYNGDPGQFTVDLHPDHALKEDPDLVLLAETIDPYSDNLLYDPIPYEMLRTYEEKPRVVVEVDGEEAICKKLDCQFEYSIPESKVTSFTFYREALALTFSGEALPASSEDLVRIEFAEANCKVDLETLGTEVIKCQVEADIVCGSYTPKILTKMGFIPVEDSVAPVTVDCIIDRMSAAVSELNKLGNEVLTLHGSFLPKTLDPEVTSLKVYFADAQETLCVPEETSLTHIKCRTTAFDPTIIYSSPLALKASINGQAVASNIQAIISNGILKVLSISPSSASPTLKTKIKISLDLSQFSSFARDDFNVTVTNMKNKANVRFLRVVEINEEANHLTAMFGGAWMGTYRLAIDHKVKGPIDTDGHLLNVTSAIKSVSLTSISRHGGAFFTITGTNFGSEFTDNPVQISYNGGVGSTDCILSSISATEIQCRMDVLKAPKGEEVIADLVVFQKASEEAECEAKGDCFIKFLNTPEVTAAVVGFEEEEWFMKITGTGFSGLESAVELKIGEVKQALKQLTATEAVFKLTDLPVASLAGKISLLFEAGKPDGMDVFENALLQVTPKLLEVSPSLGSALGSKIKIKAPGIAKDSLGQYQVQTSSSEDLCESVAIEAYPYITCFTASGETASGEITLVKGETKISCEEGHPTNCLYEQAATAFPQILSYSSKSVTVLEITGSGFDFNSSFLPQAIVFGFTPDSIEIHSASQLSLTFLKGIPTGTAPISLWFEKDGVAQFANSTLEFSNPASVSSSTAGLTCSFAGGCLYEVASPGLTTSMSKASSKLLVCDTRCEPAPEKSSAEQFVCRVPPVATTYSNKNFGIEKDSHNLNSGVHFGTSKDPGVVFDDDITVSNEDESKECVVGMEFREGYVGFLSQVKYFMGDIEDKALYKGVLEFQGSTDGVSYTSLFTVDVNIHEGWNYFNWDNPAQAPKYRFYRFKGGKGSCNMHEAKFRGIQAIYDEQTAYACGAKLVIEDEIIETSLNPVIYSGSKTPMLRSVSPRYGTVTGGDSVTFFGEGFPADPALFKILIDGIECLVSAATATSLTCTTGPRPGLVEPSFSIFVEGCGFVSTNEVSFTYVNQWTDDHTWGGEFAPMEMESIHIPKGLNLLVNIDKTPKLNAIVVEGSLIFAPEADPAHLREFDASYIFINGGSMEVGTEEFPYTSKLTITMHGQVSDPYIPIYGNKVIGLRYGRLDMHGVKREPTWTQLEMTSLPGENKITLQEAVDWVPGEEVGIASTAFDGRQGERRTITAIDRSNPSKPVLTLNFPLDYRHYAATEAYGSDTIDMRAEVGLLSRNVKFQGDPETSEINQYGANMFLHSEGDDSLKARLAYIELYNSGQAFKVGRYSIHYHMIGSVHSSYVRGISVHKSYNRAVTLHAIQYLTIEDMVGFDIMGHAIFMEDGVERKNMIRNNLIIMVKRSWSLLNTDQTPACFWITNPDNNFVGNHAAGSDRYGFWYDLQKHAIGPSANNGICPQNERVGEHRGSVIHSVGRYGLRIFHNMVSRKNACQPVVYDPSRPDDPYWKNPAYPAVFRDVTSYKNGRNGMIAKTVGDISLINFKVADNKLAGIEISEVNIYRTGLPQVQGALCIGRSKNLEAESNSMSPRGIITARTENFGVTDVRFFNYNFNGASAFGTCSHCVQDMTSDGGSRTTNTSALYFDSTVTKRVRYNSKPGRWIFHDLDGTLTEKGPRTWVATYFKHLEVPECEVNLPVYEGVVCDSSVAIRRVHIRGYSPKEIKGQGLFLMHLSPEIDKMENETRKAYIRDKSNFGSMKWVLKGQGWSVPFVTGHKYSFFFGNRVDFTALTFQISENWQPNDKPIVLHHAFIDQRQAVKFKYRGQLQSNGSIYNEEPETGQYVLFNETWQREFEVRITGKGKTHKFDEQTMTYKGIACVGSCLEEIEEEEAPEEGEEQALDPNRIRLWSDVANWKDNQLPAEDDSVNIPPSWRMVYDLEGESPVFKKIEINGHLSFSDDHDTNLRAKIIFVRAGTLQIGTAEKPHLHKATITLEGSLWDETLALSNSIFVGNKALANLGVISMFGKSRGGPFTRLKHPVYRGDSSFRVEPWLDINPGDRLLVTTTTFGNSQNDQVFVEDYNPGTGLVKINKGLSFYHWGAEGSTAEQYNGLDMRCEVLLLTRNVKIVGHYNATNSWGASFVTMSALEADFSVRKGQLTLDNVEIENVGQRGNEAGALRIQKISGKSHRITNCAIHNGANFGIEVMSSSNVVIENNAIYNFRRSGIYAGGGSNIDIIGNIVVKTLRRVPDEPRAGIVACSRSKCSKLRVMNNIVAAAEYAGFTTFGHACGAKNQEIFKNNVAHSLNEGWGAAVGRVSSCFQLSDFAVYKIKEQGIGSVQSARKFITKNITAFDLRGGFGAGLAAGSQDYSARTIEIIDSFFFGESPMEDCPRNGGFCFRYNKFALFGSFGIQDSKKLHEAGCNLPMYNQQSHASWGGTVKLHRNTFVGFKKRTRYGQRQAIFQVNPLMYDYTPMQEFYNSVFIDVQADAIAYMQDPPRSWARIEICGNFPCTSPWNTFLSFKETKHLGQKASDAEKDFQVIPDNPGFSQFVPDCQKSSSMNAYKCKNDKLGILLFESLDADKLDRASQPIYLALQGTEMKNKLNAFKDHGWDGFYNKQERLQRFPAIIYAPKGAVYDITYTGSPAEKQNFQLLSQNKQVGITIRIAYPSAISRQIKKDGEYIPMNQWDKKIKQYGVIHQKFCGENRYIGVKNILEFYITAGCMLRVEPRNAIQGMVRMEWTLEEFFADGGTTKFVDRLASVLGIHASTIKVVSVYEGSLVVNYQIETETDEAKVDIESTQTKAFATGSVNLGAPLLDVSSGEVKIISDGVVTAPGYKPVVITRTENNLNHGLNDVFTPVEASTEETTTTETIVIQKEQIVKETQINKEIIYTEPESSFSTVIFTLIILVVLAAAIAIVYKYSTLQKELDLKDAATIRKRQLQFNEAVDKGIEVIDFDQPATEAKIKPTLCVQNDFGQQYDPTRDFSVFSLQAASGSLHKAGKEDMTASAEASTSNFLKIAPGIEERPPSTGSCHGEESISSAHPLSRGTPSTVVLPEDKEIVSDEDEL